MQTDDYLPSDSSRPRRHEHFYFEDGNVIFLIENTLFKVHRYFFVRDSTPFRAMFSLPPVEGKVPEGACDEDPIRLDGVRALDFERLLHCMYPRSYTAVPLETLEEWCSVLEIATKFDILPARDLAISSLSKIPLDPIDKIDLAQRYNVRKEWIFPSFFELSAREAPLTETEGNKLGMKLVIQLARARELLRAERRFTCAHCSSPESSLTLLCSECDEYTELYDPPVSDMMTIVARTFGMSSGSD